MACDFFTSLDATFLLKNRAILFMGDSNTRALYKDLLWLVHQGNLIPQASLCKKNEESHANDKRLSNGKLTSGRNYVEIREYSENDMLLRFEFITQLNPQKLKSVMSSFGIEVDAIVINSCVWDLTRWGPNQVDAYKKHIEDICKYVSQCHPRTRLIWLATLPVSDKVTRGFLKPEVLFIRKILPWHILEANHYTSRCCRQFKHDFIDLHYHTRGILQHRSDDGIHWKPSVTR